MRIAVFSDTFYPQVNGISYILDRMRFYMEQKDIPHLFVVPGKEETVDENLLTFPGRNFVLYPEIKLAFPKFRKIRDGLDLFQPDVIHLATQFNMGWMGLKYGRHENIPVISSYHTDYFSYLHYYHLSWLKKPLAYYLNWFHSFSRINFGPSLSTVKQMNELGVCHTCLWPHGVDSNIFNPGHRSIPFRKQHLKDDQLLLLYVGRLAPEKNLDVLLEASRILEDHDIPYRLFIVGDGPSRLSLETRAPKSVTFCGYRTGVELASIYASADVFVFPSTTETFGNVVLEAMASGLPVIATKVGGVSDNLLDEYNGLAFQSGDPVDLAEKVARLVSNRKLLENLGTQALLYAQERSWDRVFDQYIKTVEAVIRPPLDTNQIA
ncbi:MAG TPA: glycosyltransferase family 1 protein [Syntrophomonadaceae bacterium]|nr:glycosyltransferase family 1 protein [Syntrophomonadaceae bacterium]